MSFSLCCVSIAGAGENSALIEVHAGFLIIIHCYYVMYMLVNINCARYRALLKALWSNASFRLLEDRDYPCLHSN